MADRMQTVVQCENGWDVSYTSTEICAVRGSTVDINCTYTYPSTVNYLDTRVQEAFWFIQVSNRIYVDLRTDPEYSGRVEYLCGNNKCTLRISNLRESDSAVYKFRFKTNQPGGTFTGYAGVTLSVTELRCQSSCRLPDHLNYVWYKNQQKKKEGASYSDYFSPADRVTCAVKGHEDFRSPSMMVKSPNGWDVSYTSTEICAFRGSTVDITCTYTYPSRLNHLDTTVQETFWFIKESNGIHDDLRIDPEYSGRVENLCGNNKCTLRISNLRESDSAVYKFRFTTNQPTGSFTGSAGVTLSVTDPQLQVHVRRSTANPSSTWTELTCHSRCQLPDHLSYVWYNNNKPVGQKKYLHLRHFDAEDSYHCAVEGHEHFPSSALYAPKPPSVSVSPSGEIMEGSSVTLTCSSDANPAAHYTWYKRSGDKQVQRKSSGQNFTITDITAEHGGKYQCEAQNTHGRSNTTLHLTVGAGAWKSAVTGTTTALLLVVVLLAVFLWIRRNKSFTQQRECGERPEDRAQIPAAAHTRPAEPHDDVHYASVCFTQNPADAIYCNIGRVQPQRETEEDEEEEAEYSAVRFDSATGGKESEWLEYAPKSPSVSVSPSGEIMEGSSVTLTCSSDANPAAKYTWYKRSGDKQVQRLSEETQFVLSSIRSSDSGEYYCTAENELGKTASERVLINVKYAPQSSSVSVSPSGEIMEGSSVTLTCSSDANPAANYTWYKENRALLHGPENVYHLSSISSGDSGVYSCKSENQYGRINSTSLHLDVQYAPKPPSVSVSSSGEIMEGSSVTLTCSSDANPAANYTWYKEDEDSPTASGQNFTITNITAEHGGKYQCEAQNTQGRSNTTLHLTVGAAWRSALIGSAASVFLAVTLLSVFLLIRARCISETESCVLVAGRNKTERKKEVKGVWPIPLPSRSFSFL
ncbi:B-cell receptor CD22-like [Limanda limanda]|uniref:B-cell receptor CD22-like n=1 Tax=Limanda limanda TaxID=27771 RepID=UPI0029C7EAB9|nr:B-cell receptor CD22-like [Limanda limanda]